MHRGKLVSFGSRIDSKRIEMYAGSEIRFNLLALVGDKLAKMKREVEDLTAQLAK